MNLVIMGAESRGMKWSRYKHEWGKVLSVHFLISFSFLSNVIILPVQKLKFFITIKFIILATVVFYARYF